MGDNPHIDDGSDKPIGYLSDDGELIVRESVNKDGTTYRGYHETALGRERRWQRQAGDLYANWMSLVEKHREMCEDTGLKITQLAEENRQLRAALARRGGK
jgi:hypothetical protein